MLPAMIALSLMSLTPGDVVQLPANVALVEPGKLNWMLKDRFFRLPEPTSALVVRIDPEGVDGVAELKVFDGTNRLGWVESGNLTSVRVAMNLKPAAKVNPDGTYASNYGIPAGFKPTRRHRRLPDFSQVDAAIGSMAMQTMQAQAAYESRIRGGSFGSVGPGSQSGGYYYGPRQPPGHYVGGQGSSHRGGTYQNPYTGNRYQARSNPR